MNIVVSAGGTGGHIYPAVAIVNKIKEKDKDTNVLYIGTHNRMEKDIIPKLGINYEPLEIYGFSTRLIGRDIKNLFLINKAKKRCLKLFAEFKPDVVIGTGGYVTMPVIAAAHKMGIPVVIHEQNSIPGKTNRYLASKANLVFVSYENSIPYFHKAKKVIFSGNPCGENALKSIPASKKDLGLSDDKKLVLIVSGSLGSNTINAFFTRVLSWVKDDANYEVLYITGKAYYENFIKNKTFSKNVKILPYVDNMTSLLKSVDLVISRAGAGTLSEILALQIPSIIIPSPYVANNHQYYNALDLKNKNVGIMIEEKDLNDKKVFELVNDLLKDNNAEYKKMKEKLQKMGMKNSSEIIYEEIKKVL